MLGGIAATILSTPQTCYATTNGGSMHKRQDSKLGDAIQQIKNNSIRSFQVNKTDMVTSGTIHLLCDALRNNHSLTSLGFHGIKMGNNEVLPIANVLKFNNSLNKLEIIGCDIGDSGARQISDDLKANSGLRELNLSSNGISEGGAKNIANALKTNVGLVKLNISGNPIGNNGALSIIEALRFNTSLVKLNLHGVGISDAVIKSIPGNRGGWNDKDKEGYFVIDRDRDIREAEAKRMAEEEIARKVETDRLAKMEEARNKQEQERKEAVERNEQAVSRLGTILGHLE